MKLVAQVVLEDPGIDVLLSPGGGATGKIAEDRAAALIDLAKGSEKLIVPIWQASIRSQPGYDQLLEGGLPVFTDYAAACKAVALLANNYDALRKAPLEVGSPERVQLSPAGREEVIRALSKEGYLSEPEVKGIMAAAGIEIPTSVLLSYPPYRTIRI